MRQGSRELGLLVLMAGSLFVIGIDAPLLEPQESRYAQIAREMLHDGDWIVPHFNGQPYLDKPPLMYWLTGSSFALFGVSDFSARLIPALAALATILITFFWGKRLAGPALGFSAAAILALTPQFVYRGRWLSFDSVLCLWVTLALAAAHVATLSQRFWFWWIISALAAGLGFLTKGPVIFVLVALPLVAARWILHSGNDFTFRRGLVWNVVAGAVALPWFVAMSVRQPGFVEYFFWKHHVERYVAPFDHQKAFWFYIPELIVGFLPWVVLLPRLARWCLSGADPNSPSSLREVARWTAFSALWCVLFFSISGSKRATYILPCFPLLTLALACFINTQLYSRTPAICQKVGAVTWILLLGILLFWWPYYAHRFSMYDAITPHAKLTEEIPVFCYPRQWDGVHYYLRRSDVQVFSAPELTTMIAAIQQAPEILLVVRPAQLEQVILALPKAAKHQELSRNHEVVVVRIQQR